ncbi:MAG: hypothetical protein U1F43_29915 [Myxococcota bacterium]
MDLAVAAQPALARLGLGPLTVAVRSVTPWSEALADLLDGFDAGPPRGAHARADLELELGSAERPPDGPRAPSFTSRDGALVDRCEAWHAAIADGAGPVAASFQLYDGRPEAAVRRELVAAALRATLGLAAPRFGALLVHASALATASGALVFLGPSGEGKSTLARRLRGWSLLADDASLITPELACGTPLRGKEGLPRSGHPHPLRGLVFLEKGAPRLSFQPMSPAAATHALLRRVFWYARSPLHEAQLLDVVARVCEAVPAWRLASSLEHDVAPTLEAATRSAA